MSPAEAGSGRHPASFRDPAGYVFERDGDFFRAVHPSAVADVEKLFSSGLYDELVSEGLLVAHRRGTAEAANLPPDWGLYCPARLDVISYANEWSMAQLRSAALLTLEIQRRAVRHSMSLKDASTYNVQFVGAHPVFIDLLSFERLGAQRAWAAYRQFCEHFLAPLALRHHVPGLTKLMSCNVNGTPLAVASKVLPAWTWFRPGIALHIHLHARAAAVGDDSKRPAAREASARASRDFHLQITNSLSKAVRAIHDLPRKSSWSNYRQNNTYSSAEADSKLQFVRRAAERSSAKRVLDLGANDGHHVMALTSLGIACTAVEVDSACCEAIYAASITAANPGLLNTIQVDVANATPAHGWGHVERASFSERMKCDLTLSLALIHHLSIGRQVPFNHIAEFLADLAPHAVVEYVPTDDPMAQRLLAARSGLDSSYLQTLSESAFRAAFNERFDCLSRSEPLAGNRVLYHFRRRNPF